MSKFVVRPKSGDDIIILHYSLVIISLFVCLSLSLSIIVKCLSVQLLSVKRDALKVVLTVAEFNCDIAWCVTLKLKKNDSIILTTTLKRHH